jgi:hypothetical protein
MRFLALGLASLFALGAVSVANACPSNQQNVSIEQQIVSSDQTPIKIPSTVKSDG